MTPLQKEIRGIGDHTIMTHGTTTVELQARVGNKTSIITLRSVLYMPDAVHNLSSLTRLDQDGRSSLSGGDKPSYMTKIKHCLPSLLYTMGYMSYDCANMYLTHVCTKHVPGMTGTGDLDILESRGSSAFGATIWLMDLPWYHLHLSTARPVLKQNNPKHLSP